MSDYVPYVYRIKHIPSGKYYIGSRTSKYKYRTANPNDLLTRYFTSSRNVRSLIERDGVESFEIVDIIKTKDSESALHIENDMLLSVDNREEYLNLNFKVGNTKKMNSGKITINNGVKNRYIGLDDDIPEGWVVGRKMHSNTINSLTRKVKHKGKIYDSVKELKIELGVCLKTVYNKIERKEIEYV